MFKLVKIDDECHREVELIDGTQVIGRDQIFDCDDKRVSRRHAEIVTTVDSVSIKALHTNPCFIIKNDMAYVKVLQQNATISIGHGDQLGFLPDSQWYQIKRISSEEENSVGKSEIPRLKTIISKILAATNGPNIYTITWANGTNSDTKSKDSETNDRLQEYRQLASPTKEDDSTQCYQQNTTEQGRSKRTTKQEPSSPDIKKIKKEEDDEQSGDSIASTSGKISTSKPLNDEPKKKRERCMYGKDCYRRNPQHKEVFSHPADEDWGSGKQAECPYGYACVKSDPRHWRDHSHPYGMHPPPPPGIKKRRTHVVQRNGRIFYINANVVNFYDDHFETEDSDGDSMDHDYEFD